MSRRSWSAGIALSVMLSVATNDVARACAFHGYTPDPTLIDVLLGTEQAVVARLSPSSRTGLEPVETLLGSEVTEIPVTVGRDTLARLRSDRDATVLLARDGAYGPWLEVAVLDTRFRSLIDQVVQRQSAWLYGGQAERLAVFAGLLNDSNPDLRRLALRELDRAPYDELKATRLPAVPSLSRDLKAGEDDLRPIRILLAGLSRDRGFAPILQNGLEEAVRRDVAYLGAYATALIELEGESAVDRIVDGYLKPETLSWGTQEKLLQALALQHKSGAPATRRAITRGVAELARLSPNLREAAARQFGSRIGWRSGTGGSGKTQGNGASDR